LKRDLKKSKAVKKLGTKKYKQIKNQTESAPEKLKDQNELNDTTDRENINNHIKKSGDRVKKINAA
jgi:hypothetical protein